jgi:zinc protease
MRNFSVLSLLFVFLFVFCVFSSGEKVMGLGYKEYTLSNGLKVVIVERKILPIVSVQLWYRVGAVDEIDGKSGLAHFLEHMSFKGTKNLKPGEFSRIIKSLGGSDNAATSHDYTMYYVDVSSEHLSKVLPMLKEMMFDLVLDPKEFESERKVILEERRMRYEDNPMGQFFEDFLYDSFKKINYRRPVIGWEEDIKSLTIDDMLNFYNTYYSPKNAILVIVGNVSSDKIIDEVRKVFDINQKNSYQKAIEIEKISEINSGKVEFKTIRKDANTKAVIVGFRTPSYLDSPKEVVALDLLAYIISDGRSSKLYQKMVVDKKIASSVSGGQMLGKYPFLTYILAIANPDVSLEDLKREMISSILEVGREINDEDLKVAKKKMKADFVYEFEKNHGIASSIGWAYCVLGDYRELDKFLEISDKISLDDIKSVLNKYFRDENMIVGVLTSGS